MRLIGYPDKLQLEEICRRPAMDSQSMRQNIEAIVNDIKDNGDLALRSYTEKFDGITLKEIQVEQSKFEQAEVSRELHTAVDVAINNISAFHAGQIREEQKVITCPGVVCFRKQVPIETVGLYIPGGSAPLISTLLMLAVPAKLAGCKRIVVCSPPEIDQSVNPAILFSARKLGISEVYSVGGAQAIAALAYGTETIPKVDKIFGPGNQYVSAAKALLSSRGIAVDLPAGPSELAVIADEDCPAAFVTADLLSQLEHGPDSQVILISWSNQLVERVQEQLKKQLDYLPRKDIAVRALENSFLVLVTNQEEAIRVANSYAPEHLILAVKDYDYLANNVSNAGSVFLGYYSPEALGDYASGTNHVLPTNGAARAFSGVALDSFTKTISFQEATLAGLQALGETVVTLARAEKLEGHAQAILKRIKKND